MRAVIAVVLSFIAMSMLVFALSVAPWFVLGLDHVMKAGRFDSTSSYNAYAVLVAILGAILGGWLCMTIGRSRIAVGLLAVLGLAAGITNHFAQHHKAEPGVRQPGVTVTEAVARHKEPDWFTLLIPCVGVAGVLAGGWRAARARR